MIIDNTMILGLNVQDIYHSKCAECLVLENRINKPAGFSIG